MPGGMVAIGCILDKACLGKKQVLLMSRGWVHPNYGGMIL